jgi:predicted NAD/FAD-binding protein
MHYGANGISFKASGYAGGNAISFSDVKALLPADAEGSAIFDFLDATYNNLGELLDAFAAAGGLAFMQMNSAQDDGGWRFNVAVAGPGAILLLDQNPGSFDYIFTFRLAHSLTA